jgi:20S proteasome alpha/beta subunit
MTSKRPQERRRTVTLIAGMVCKDGIVMAADTEQSGYFRKSNVPKLESYDATFSVMSSLAGGNVGCSVIIAGAGHGDMADYASRRIAKEAKAIQSMDEVELRLEAVLEDIFTKRFQIYKPDDLGIFRLLIAIRAPDSNTPKLFSSYGATLVERNKFVLGSGVLVDYVLDQIYDSSMTTDDGVAASLGLLQIAKKYVEGVGGESKIAVMSKEGRIQQKPDWEVTEEETILAKHAKIANRLMLAMMRTRTDTEDQWKKHLATFAKEIEELREKKKESDQKIKDLMAWWNNYWEQEQAQREKEKSQKLPYLLDKPAKNLFEVEGNVFTGKSVPGAKLIKKLPFKQA